MKNNNILYAYKNGNVNVTIYEDGTKIREWPDDEAPVSTHPESCDLKVTQFCDLGNICVYCFPPGTKISQDGLTQNIEDIGRGDGVWSFGENGKELNVVYDLFENDYDGDLIELEFDDGSILKLTPNHKVFTQERGFVRADALLVTDQIMRFDK